MIRILKSLLVITGLFAAMNAYANISIPMTIVSGGNATQAAGNIVVSETKYGLLFTPDLHGLAPSTHGFHIHQIPSCDKEGMAAGSHLDPRHTNKHHGPYEDSGHLGDLPALTINADGTANLPVLAPRIKHLAAIKNHSLMIHEGGDNYSDLPIKLGGGGGRMVCGVIK